MPAFLPDMILPGLTAVTEELLLSRGIDFLMLDFDNTIVPYTTDVPTENMERWLRMMQTSKVRLCIVSNTKKRRVRDFCEKYGLNYVMHAKKPFHRGIDECLSRFSLRKEQAALVGDQIFTDVLGANTAGLTSILIPAIHNHNILLKLRHAAELPFIAVGRIRLRLMAGKLQKKSRQGQKN